MKKQRILNFILVGVSIFIIIVFLLGVLKWDKHWWILIAWFLPILGGVAISSSRK